MTALSARPGAARKRWSKRLTIIAFLLPALVLYVVFVLLPIAQAARYSLYKWNGLQPLTDFIGLKNYEVALASPGFWSAVGNNALIIVLSLLIQIPFSLALAVMLNRRFPGRGGAAPDLLPALRPVGGDHGHRVQPHAPATRRAGHGPRAGRPGLPGPGLAGRQHLRHDHPVRDHLVEVLRLPHDPHAGRAPGDPTRDRGGRPDRRGGALAGLPLRHPAAAGADASRLRCSSR